MKLNVGSRTDLGKLRERNEDSLLVKDRLFAVADGMGGHRGGDVASSMAIEALDGLALPDDAPLEVLVEEIKAANRSVLARGEAHRNLRGMGTTVTAFLTDGDKAYVAHVGDSRAYLLRDGAFQHLTEDHTLVQRMVRDGRITAEQADHHPQRSILTRALGVDEDLTVDDLTLDIHPGDRILLCTDGLTGMVDEDRIQEILESEPDPQRASDQLVEEANRAGGEDNITVVVIDVMDGEAGGPALAAADRSTPARERPRSLGGQASAVDTAVREPVTEVHDAVPPDASPPPRRRRRRALVWAFVVVVLLVGAWLGVRVYLSHQWYVGESNGQVAIYQGMPASVLGFDLSHPRVRYRIPAAAAERLQVWTGLKEGITVESLTDAKHIVALIRDDVGRSASSSP
jgi:serine/threonine protein phosphatase PrpC